MDSKVKHLEMIQAVIGRMSNHSFLLKGWSVTLVGAIVALSAEGSDHTFILFAYFTTAAFWCLDGYFLRRERLFRELYDHVRFLKAEDVDFSMDASELDGKPEQRFVRVCFSETLFIFHGALFGSVVLMMFLFW